MTAAVIALALTGILTALAIAASLPLLQRYALARPNARSSHRQPTPQGGGWAVVAATLVVWLALLPLTTPLPGSAIVAAVAAAALLLGLLGAWDDLRTVGVGLRLAVQTAVVGAVIGVLAVDGRFLPWLGPWPFEWLMLTVVGVWFVNLVNFMDGLDWMTVAQMLPLTLAVGGFGLAGIVEPWTALLAAALAGGLLGFAPFNKPTARLFLGDVGSLPIGFLAGVLILELVRAGHLTAALLLPLYYVADTGLTLARRILRRQRFWQAHRTHYYQRATDHGMTPLQVARDVAVLNLALVALATVTVVTMSWAIDVLALGLGAGLVGSCLWRFTRPRAAPIP
ncbi:MAG: glycosyltransferase family 4 protein [Geminicoccaceae bacterium]|nr:MAG: glycosyltransferase family 4 protein [Geminicoccaceae bacterium]